MGREFQEWKFHLKISPWEEKPCLLRAYDPWGASFSSRGLIFGGEEISIPETWPIRKSYIQFLTTILHHGLRNCFFFRSHLLFPYSFWTFISLFYLDLYISFSSLDFYFSFLFGLFFQLFFISFLILFQFLFQFFFFIRS